jgi:hypothetical protein
VPLLAALSAGIFGSRLAVMAPASAAVGIPGSCADSGPEPPIVTVRRPTGTKLPQCARPPGPPGGFKWGEGAARCPAGCSPHEGACWEQSIRPRSWPILPVPSAPSHQGDLGEDAEAGQIELQAVGAPVDLCHPGAHRWQRDVRVQRGMAPVAFWSRLPSDLRQRARFLLLELSKLRFACRVWHIRATGIGLQAVQRNSCPHQPADGYELLPDFVGGAVHIQLDDWHACTPKPVKRGSALRFKRCYPVPRSLDVVVRPPLDLRPV